MFDSTEHMDEPLLSDDQPSWATMGNVDDDKNSDEPWDRPDESPLRKSNSGEDRIVDDLPKIILFMRLGNIGAAALLIFGSILNLTNILAFSTMVLAGYGVCFGSLICCLEVNLSILRHPIADNFGFLYNPVLRLMFYILMGMVAWSFGTLLGLIASVVLVVLSVFNTYIICRYPGYRAVLKELAEEDEKRIKEEMNRQIMKRTLRHVGSPEWTKE